MNSAGWKHTDDEERKTENSFQSASANRRQTENFSELNILDQVQAFIFMKTFQTEQKDKRIQTKESEESGFHLCH